MKPDYWSKNNRETRNGNHKSTRKWCKGVLGREHVLEVKIPPNIPGVEKDACHWFIGLDDHLWLCHHYAVCSACGKLVDKIDRTLCPDFLALP